jgi:hypothetical protein
MLSVGYDRLACRARQTLFIGYARHHTPLQQALRGVPDVMINCDKLHYTLAMTLNCADCDELYIARFVLHANVQLQ